MTREELFNRVTRLTNGYWENFIEIRPALVRFNPPKIVLNPRLWVTGGYAKQEEREMNLSIKFIVSSQKHAKFMQQVIIPHELAHHADFDLYGFSEKACGHGEQWAKLMVDFGLPADKHIPWEYRPKKNFSLKGII